MAIEEKVPKTKHDDLLFTLDEIMIIFEPTAQATATRSLQNVLDEIGKIRPVQNAGGIKTEFDASYTSAASNAESSSEGFTAQAASAEQMLIEEAPSSEGNVITFGLNADTKHRIVFLDLDSDNPDDKATVKDKKAIVRILRDINARIKADNERYSGIVTVSPNWLMSASNGGSGTGGGGVGGPGTRPVAYESTGGKPPYQFRFFKLIEDGKDAKGPLYKRDYLTLNDWGNSEKAAPTPPIVKVAILDAFPAEAQLTELADNELWKKLKPLRVKQNREINLGEIRKYKEKYPMGHDYKMASHGLFIAGIIRSIAKDAEIKGYRVLDDKGVGTLRSILWGLQQVLADYPDDGSPLIVNMSLTMNFLYSNGKSALLGNKAGKLFEEWTEVIKDAQTEYEDRQKKNQLARENQQNLTIPEEVLETQLAYLRLALTLAITQLKKRRNTVIVAAAGNEGDKDNPNPAALYPAAYYDVVGVASLNMWKEGDRNNVSLTKYSCLADAPPSRGFAVCGGNSEDFNSRLADSGPIADEQDGLLGLWVGDLPTPVADESKRKKGWARWSGTSFATPIIVGALAMLIAEKKAADTDEAIFKLQTTWNERVTDATVPHVVLAEQFSP
jgi:hypothetical protein